MQRRQNAFLSRLISHQRVQRAHEAFHTESGQVFAETSCSMESMIPSWVTAATGSTADLINFRSVESVGAACLEHVAIRSVLLQLDNLDHQTLACVPWTVGKKIWLSVQRFRLDSLRNWRLFVRAYPEERDAFQETRKVRLLNPGVHYKFDVIVKQITAPNFEWITHLILQDPDLSKSGWNKLVNIQNLGVLVILGPMSSDSHLDDRVVRGWSEAAADSNALSRLRVVFLIGQRWITEHSLHYLRTLPALTICNMTGCDVDLVQAADSGWKQCIGDELSHILNIEWAFSANPHDGMRAYYRRAGSPTLSSKKAEVNEEPVLSLYRRTTDLPLLSTYTSLWFLRNILAPGIRSKHEEAQKPTEPPNKKRKIRGTKEKNLGNVLDGFGL